MNLPFLFFFLHLFFPSLAAIVVVTAIGVPSCARPATARLSGMRAATTLTWHARRQRAHPTRVATTAFGEQPCHGSPRVALCACPIVTDAASSPESSPACLSHPTRTSACSRSDQATFVCQLRAHVRSGQAASASARSEVGASLPAQAAASRRGEVLKL